MSTGVYVQSTSLLAGYNSSFPLNAHSGNKRCCRCLCKIRFCEKRSDGALCCSYETSGRKKRKSKRSASWSPLVSPRTEREVTDELVEEEQPPSVYNRGVALTRSEGFHFSVSEI